MKLAYDVEKEKFEEADNSLQDSLCCNDDLQPFSIS